MAKKIIIDVEAKTSDAEASLGDVVKELKKLNKQSQQATQQLDEGLKDVKNSADGASKGFFKFSNILKGGLIITALNKAFEFFKETLGQNQVVVDFFATTFETLSLAFNDFFNFLFDNVGGVVDTFKSIFENPGKSIKDFGTAIKNNLIERFNSFLDTLGFVASAVKKVFSGDFKGALEDVKSAGKESIDVLTGVDNTFDKTVETVTKVAKATKNYVTETINAAQANVELTKQAEIARVRQQGLVESFDLQAEKLRQVRDEERNTIEDRIKANNELGKVLDQQEEAMLKQVDMQIKAAQAEFDKNKNQENTIALLEAQQEKEAVLAQIAGFRSEQKSNDLALDRELIEMTNSKLEAETNLSIEQKRFNAEQIKDNLQRLEKQKEIDQQEQELQQTRLQKIIDEANVGTQAKIDAQIALDEFMEQSRQQNITREKEITLEKKKIDDEDLANRKLIEKQKKDAVANTFGAIANILGEASKAGKAFATGQALINTFQGVTEVLSSKSVLPEPIATIARIANIATVLATGFKTVKQINSVQPMASGAGLSTSGSAVATPTPQAPSFNIVGASAENQLAQTLADATQKPIKAFVVAGDVSTAQSLDRNIIQESSLG